MRQASPALTGFMVNPGSSTQNNGPDTKAARLYALSQLASFQEVVQTVPIPYREILKPLLAELGKVASKVTACNRALNTLIEHQNKGTRPSQTRGLTVPVFQVCKEFLGSDAEKVLRDHLAAMHLAYVSDALDTGIKAKSAEKAFLQGLLEPEKWHADLEKAAKNLYDSQLVHRKAMVWQQAVTPENGEAIPAGYVWKDDPNQVVIFRQLKEDLLPIGYKIIDLVMQTDIALAAKDNKKRTLKDQADVEMDDGDDEAPLKKKDLRALIGQELRKASNLD
ncbi:hypothetical protein BDV93DRAFT_559427 [Ceratobasidium sp. AG-I]|nr:hypothetical protein BDV93DRAFT_559427 [Ceratobasidium sp. AG-I]